MNIGWPQGIWIGLTIFSLIVGAAMDGKPRTGEHRFALTFVFTLLGFGLLYWGGFFS